MPTEFIDPQGSIPRYALHINGKPAAACSGEWYTSYNPATGEAFAQAPAAGSGDVALAVEAAHRAFHAGPWPQLSSLERGKLLYRFAQTLDANLERLIALEMADSGQTITDTRRVLGTCVTILEYYAGWATKILGATIPNTPSTLLYTQRQPIGVAAIITPWNFPLMMFMTKVAPALAAGCTVVVKPSPETPVTALEAARLASEAGLPEGVLNVLSTPGPEVGQALVQHPAVSLVSFTGGTATGKTIARDASHTLKRLALELGGKSANIVFDDADLEAAASASVWGIFANAGQSCIAGSRLLVQRGIHDAFVERFVERARRIRLGQPHLPETQVGPLISRQHRSRVKRFVELGCEEGADLVLGGQFPDDPQLSQGFFLTPAILQNVNNTMQVAQEEIFGPVVSIIPFETEAKAVQLANDNRYGLAAGVWSNNISRAHRVARQLQAGTVWINAYRLTSVLLPFGGFKESGYGREYSLEGIEPFTETKSVYVNLDPAAHPTLG